MKNRLTFIFIFIFWLINPTSIFACVCDTTTFSEEFKEASAIFSARYIGAEYRKGIVSESVELHLSVSGEKKNYETLVLKFEVEKWWKGDLKKEVVLVTDVARFSDGSGLISDCEIAFQKGERYLIYAFGEKDKLQTGACSRTARLRKAKNDLRLLGKGKKPLA